MTITLTVFFEDPFWVGVFERTEDGKLSVCKVTFGAEPKDYEVWEFVLQHYNELIFSPTVEAALRHAADNPKRRSRNARKQTEHSGTRSQQALQLQREEMKTERRKNSREERDAEAQRRFEMKQAKKKEKRRGH